MRGDAVAVRPERGLSAVGHADLLEHPREVRLDRLLADLETAGDQLVRQPGGDELEHLALALAEVVGARLATRLSARAQHGARRLRRQRRLAARRGADAAVELV